MWKTGELTASAASGNLHSCLPQLTLLTPLSLYCSHGGRRQEEQESWKKVHSNPTVTLGPYPSQLGLWWQNMVGQVASRADIYFSCFWRLSRPRSGWWPIQCWAKALFLVWGWPSSQIFAWQKEGSSPQSLLFKEHASIHEGSTLRTGLPPNSMGDEASPYELGWGAGRHSFHSSKSLIFYEPCLLFLCGGFSTDCGLIVILCVEPGVRKSVNSRCCQTGYRSHCSLLLLPCWTITRAHCLLYRTGDKCVLNFKPCGLFGKELHKVEGYIQDKR